MIKFRSLLSPLLLLLFQTLSLFLKEGIQTLDRCHTNSIVIYYRIFFTNA